MNSSIWEKFCFVFVAIMLVLSFIVVPILENSNQRTVTVTVTDKGIQRNSSSGKDEYLIFCKTTKGDVLVLRNEDSLMKGKFNSSDVYAQIEIGSKYEFKICGARVPLFSMYPNIIRLKKIS